MVEFFLVPFLFIVYASNIISKSKKELEIIYKLTNYILSITVILLLIFAAASLVKDSKNFVTWENLKDFLLPTILSLAFMPFLYLLTLYGVYDKFFSQLDIWLKKHKKLLEYTKWQALLTCNFSIKRINSLSQRNAFKFMEVENKSQITKLIKELSNKKSI